MTTEPVSVDMPRLANERVFGLDVVRASAMLLVLLSHAANVFCFWCGIRLPMIALHGGSAGVELFFVLSGYLIGGILLRCAGCRPSGRVWRNFMVRRALRTLPAYFTVLLVLACVTQALGWPPGGGNFVWHVLRYGSFTQNLLTPSPESWFAVSWSLSVEEWFYLLFAAAFLGLAQILSLNWALLLSLAPLIIGPLVLRALHPQAEVNARAMILWLDGPGFGVLSAFVLRHVSPSRGVAAALAMVGFGLVVAVWAGNYTHLPILPDGVTHVAVRDVLATGFVLMLPGALALPPPGAGVRGAVRALADLSYCIYLVHLCILQLFFDWAAAGRLPPAVKIAACLLAIPFLSVLLHRLVERPFMALRPPSWPRGAAKIHPALAGAAASGTSVAIKNPV